MLFNHIIQSVYIFVKILIIRILSIYKHLKSDNYLKPLKDSFYPLKIQKLIFRDTLKFMKWLFLSIPTHSIILKLRL